jgi:hypothetical protein
MAHERELKGESGGVSLRKGNVSRIAVCLRPPTTHARSSTCMGERGRGTLEETGGTARGGGKVCWGKGMTGADEK